MIVAVVKVVIQIIHDKGVCAVSIDGSTSEVDFDSKNSKGILFPRHVELIQSVLRAMQRCEGRSRPQKSQTEGG